MKVNSIKTSKTLNYQNFKNNRYELSENGYFKQPSPIYDVDRFDSVKQKQNQIYQNLKNEEVLYDIYSNNYNKISQRVLYNETMMEEIYQDKEFLDASNKALRKAILDKLDNDDLDENDRYELSFLYEVLKNGQTDNVKEDSCKDNLNIVKFNKPNAQRQLAFGTIFNYGFFNKPKTRRQKAEAIVNRMATAAAAESALLLQVSTTAETAALTATTISMCHKICATYQMPGGAVSALISQVTGAMAGKTLASWATKWFPGVENLANATITYSLHQAQGRAIIEWCERHFDDPDTEAWDVAAKGIRLFDTVAKMGPNPVDVLGEDGFQL